MSEKLRKQVKLVIDNKLKDVVEGNLAWEDFSSNLAEEICTRFREAIKKASFVEPTNGQL